MGRAVARFPGFFCAQMGKFTRKSMGQKSTRREKIHPRVENPPVTEGSKIHARTRTYIRARVARERRVRLSACVRSRGPMMKKVQIIFGIVEYSPYICPSKARKETTKNDSKI